MTWVGDLGIMWRDLAFSPSGAVAYVLSDDAGALQAYDTAALKLTSSYPSVAPADRLLAGPKYLVVVRGLLGGNPQTQIEIVSYAAL